MVLWPAVTLVGFLVLTRAGDRDGRLLDGAV
jgi:hypothetical protein